MNDAAFSPMQRVLTAIGQREPDRVPYFLLLTMHGAKELGLPLREYFSHAENVVEGQKRLHAKYGGDCLFPFFYAPIELYPWGGDVVFNEDGPPNSGEPFLRDPEQILSLEPPDPLRSSQIQEVLKATAGLKDWAGERVPIIGVVMSPYSVPVMQMGFDAYIDLIYERPELCERLLAINEEFCVRWAGAQLAAGATAICYFDPLSSPTIMPAAVSNRFGFPMAKRTIARIPGATAIHLASGRSLTILDRLSETGTAIVGVSAEENLAEVKAACRGRLTVLGNLNGIQMRHWTPAQTEEAVRSAIAAAGRGGGYILSDNHGEIPFQVPDEVLLNLAEAVRRWGHYPLQWVDADAG